MISATLADAIEYFTQDASLLWTSVSFGYFLLATYSALLSPLEYPRWFWGPSLVLSAAILLNISAGFLFEDAIAAHFGYLMAAAALLFLGTFFYVSRVYAKHRKTIDDALSDVQTERAYE